MPAPLPILRAALASRANNYRQLRSLSFEQVGPDREMNGTCIKDEGATSFPGLFTAKSRTAVKSPGNEVGKGVGF